MSEGEGEYKCRFCDRVFKIEHLHARHERCQCRKRATGPIDYREQIEKTGHQLVDCYNEFLAMEDEDKKDELREVLKEALSQNRALIALKNLRSYYKFKCEHCDEGFEYERERMRHENDCVYTKFDKTTDTAMEKQHIQIQPKKKDGDVVGLKTAVDEITKELSLIRREIQQLQEGHTKLRELCTVVTEVRDQLEDLKDLKFQLALFKAAALKGSSS